MAGAIGAGQQRGAGQQCGAGQQRGTARAGTRGLLLSGHPGTSWPHGSAGTTAGVAAGSC